MSFESILDMLQGKQLKKGGQMKTNIRFLMLSLIVVAGGLFAETSNQGGTSEDAAKKQCVLLPHLDGKFQNSCDHEGKTYLMLEFIRTDSKMVQSSVSKYKALERAAAFFAHSRIISLSNVAKTINFVDEYDIKSDVALDLVGITKRGFKIKEVPTIIVLDVNNNIIFRHEGELKETDIDILVQKLAQ